MLTRTRTHIPQSFVDSVVHGVELGTSTISSTDTYEGKPLLGLAYQWQATIQGYLTLGLLPSEAASLRAVLAESAMYAFTHNYGDVAEKESFPKDFAFAQQADAILTFLDQASKVTFHLG